MAEALPYYTRLLLTYQAEGLEVVSVNGDGTPNFSHEEVAEAYDLASGKKTIITRISTTAEADMPAAIKDKCEKIRKDYEKKNKDKTP